MGAHLFGQNQLEEVPEEYSRTASIPTTAFLFRVTPPLVLAALGAPAPSVALKANSSSSSSSVVATVSVSVVRSDESIKKNSALALAQV